MKETGAEWKNIGNRKNNIIEKMEKKEINGKLSTINEKIIKRFFVELKKNSFYRKIS